MRKHWRIGLLGLFISLLAGYLISTQIDFAVLGDALRTARWAFVLLCMVLLFIGLIARALRWRLLLSNALPLRRTFHIMNVAYMVNNLLPLRIGEVARAYLATRAEPPVPVFTSVSTIVVERLLDLLAVVLLVLGALVAGPVPQEVRQAALFMGLLGVSGFVLMVFLSHQRSLAHRLMAVITARFPTLERLNIWLDQFLDGLLPLANIGTLMGALLWTGLSWMFSVMAGYVLMYTFYDSASLAVTCLYIAAAAFAIAVPAVPGNLGTYEGSILLALNALGYGEPATVAVAFAVTVHVVNLAVHAVTGVLGFVEEGISLQQLQQGVREVTEAQEGFG
ncbi:MAG: hypothetical protein OHK0046_25930 [Anaerolineae bacterium]